MNLKNKLIGFIEILKFDNWLSIIFQTLFKPWSKLFVYKLKKKEYLLNKTSGDIPGFRAIISSNEYKPFLNLFKNFKQITLLDLGANVGGFPVLLDSMNIKIKKLVAVEYNPNTFYRLGINISSNFNYEYYLLNKAVVGYDRNISKNITMGGTGDSIYDNTKTNSSVNKIIPGITFDQIYNAYFDHSEIIDLVKIDIEGTEYEIFENKNYIQLQNCKFLLIELHSLANKSMNFIISKLIELDFEMITPNISKNKNVFFFRNLKFIGEDNL